MSAAMEHAAMVVPFRPPSSAEARRVESLLIQLSTDVARLDAKVDGIADTQRDLREELRQEVRLLRTDIKAVNEQRASDLKVAAELRVADGPALQWAKWQRGFVFWLAVTTAVALIGALVDHLAGWGLTAGVAGRFH